MRLINAASFPVILMIAGGCSGGGGSGGDEVAQPPPPPPPPPPPGVGSGGLWFGAISWEPRNGLPGGVMNVHALIAETGEFRLVLFPDFDHRFQSQNDQVLGTFDIRDDGITTVGDAVWVAPVNATGDDWARFGLAGAFSPGDRIAGTFQANWNGWAHVEERIGSISMNYHSIYRSPSSFDILKGTYRTLDEVLTIDAQGAIFYQSSINGCTGNGAAALIDANFNMYRMEIELENCVGNDDYRNGLTFTGLANIGHNNDYGGGFLNSTIEMAVTAYWPGPFSDGYVPWSMLAHKD